MSYSIVLASSSSYRASLLQQFKLEFTQFSPDIDESSLPEEHPSDMALRLSNSKANAAKTRFPESIIIASDQVAYNPSEHLILGKPLTTENAIAQLQQCSGKTIEFYTGLCVIHLVNKRCEVQSCVEKFTVVFRELKEIEIRRYVNNEKPLYCAGAFKVEGLGITLFERLEGNDYNTLIGLPLIKLASYLRNCGLHLP